ncbi:MAG: RidA family protein [Candidatus Zixiibacteriota bacterium]
MSERQNISSGAPWETRVGYSRAVRVGNQVFVTGTIALDEKGSVAFAGDAGAQAERALEIIERALQQAGAGLSDVVRTRMYLTRIDDWEAVGRAHGRVFGQILPATSLIEVSRLIDPLALVEIEAEAVVTPTVEPRGGPPEVK